VNLANYLGATSTQSLPTTSTSQIKTVPMDPLVPKVTTNALTSRIIAPAATTSTTHIESDEDDDPMAEGTNDNETSSDREEEATGDAWLQAVERAYHFVPSDGGEPVEKLDGSHGESDPMAVDVENESAENPEKEKGKDVDGSHGKCAPMAVDVESVETPEKEKGKDVDGSHGECAVDVESVENPGKEKGKDMDGSHEKSAPMAVDVEGVENPEKEKGKEVDKTSYVFVLKLLSKTDTDTLCC
jgi:hypothetical protein